MFGEKLPILIVRVYLRRHTGDPAVIGSKFSPRGRAHTKNQITHIDHINNHWNLYPLIVLFFIILPSLIIITLFLWKVVEEFSSAAACRAVSEIWVILDVSPTVWNIRHVGLAWRKAYLEKEVGSGRMNPWTLLLKQCGRTKQIRSHVECRCSVFEVDWRTASPFSTFSFWRVLVMASSDGKMLKETLIILLNLHACPLIRASHLLWGQCTGSTLEHRPFSRAMNLLVTCLTTIVPNGPSVTLDHKQTLILQPSFPNGQPCCSISTRCRTIHHVYGNWLARFITMQRVLFYGQRWMTLMT